MGVAASPPPPLPPHPQHPWCCWRWLCSVIYLNRKRTRWQPPASSWDARNSRGNSSRWIVAWSGLLRVSVRHPHRLANDGWRADHRRRRWPARQPPLGQLLPPVGYGEREVGLMRRKADSPKENILLNMWWFPWKPFPQMLASFSLCHRGWCYKLFTDHTVCISRSPSATISPCDVHIKFKPPIFNLNALWWI